MLSVRRLRCASLRAVWEFRAKEKLFQGFNRLYHRTACLEYQKQGSHDGPYRIDLRSDTLTQPSDAMRQAMANAAVGDDVYGEDPTVNELQRKMAKVFEMDSALFVPTGTMGNLICVMAHCQERGSEILLGDKCHIHLSELGNVSQIGGIHPRVLMNYTDGTFGLGQLRDGVRSANIHNPITRVVCLENTHNVCGGKVFPLQFIENVREIADEYGLGVHLDGARLLNAAVALGVSPSRLLRDVDTVSMCFSKGVGAPAGSIIAGSDKFITSARRIRKALGGGMRQVGVLAAAALVGLEDAMERLTLDHRHAKVIAQAFHYYGKGLTKVDVEGVQSNIVMVDVQNITAAELHRRLDSVSDNEYNVIGEQIRLSTHLFTPHRLRVVTNCNVSDQDTQLAVDKIRFVLEEIEASMDQKPNAN